MNVALPPPSRLRRSMTEQLSITHLGHRGDGVADTPTGPLYVPYTLPGEIVTVEPVPGHPDRRHLLHVDKREPRTRRAGLHAFRHVRRLRAPASGRLPNTIIGSAIWSSRRWPGKASIAPVDELIDAHGEGRRRAVVHARRGTHDVLEVGFTALARASHRRHRRLPDPRAGPRRRDRGRLGDCRGAQADAKAARHPGHRDRQRARYRRARLRPAQQRRPWRPWPQLAEQHRSRAAHAARRTGGAAGAADADGSASHRCRCRRALSCRPPRRAKQHWRGWSANTLAKPSASPTCSAASAPFALRLAERARDHRGRQRCRRNQGAARARRR